MLGEFQAHLQGELERIRAAGLYKGERIITSSQQSHITVPMDRA